MDTQIRKAIAYLSRIIGKRFPRDLYADMYQQAALRIVEAGASDDRSMFRCARCGVAQEYNRYRKEMAAQVTLMQIRRTGFADGGLPPNVRSDLAKIFLECRNKRGDRGRTAASRDAAILDLLARGYSDDGIALELGISWYSVREYRKIIKRNLRKELDRRQKNQYTVGV